MLASNWVVTNIDYRDVYLDGRNGNTRRNQRSYILHPTQSSQRETKNIYKTISISFYFRNRIVNSMFLVRSRKMLFYIKIMCFYPWQIVGQDFLAGIHQVFICNTGHSRASSGGTVKQATHESFSTEGEVVCTVHCWEQIQILDALGVVHNTGTFPDYITIELTIQFHQVIADIARRVTTAGILQLTELQRVRKYCMFCLPECQLKRSQKSLCRNEESHKYKEYNWTLRRSETRPSSGILPESNKNPLSAAPSSSIGRDLCPSAHTLQNKYGTVQELRSILSHIKSTIVLWLACGLVSTYLDGCDKKKHDDM